ncbi:MAG: TetR/AcrR family transcriptional regulator [Anaerolineae bacterium]|nr:TetR/AcrR family transcriptional regulator [Anaerolineae bacterium]
MLLNSEEKVDLRILRTRKMLVQAFMDLLREKDLQAITVSDIAERAMVNRATFYAHFTDKYDLFAYMVQVRFETAVCEGLSSTTGEFNLENLRILILVVFAFMQELNGGCATPAHHQFRPMVETQVQMKLYEILGEWVEADGGDRLTAVPLVTVSMLSWTIFGMGIQWSQHTFAASAEQVIDQLLVTFTDGLFSK